MPSLPLLIQFAMPDALAGLDIALDQRRVRCSTNTLGKFIKGKVKESKTNHQTSHNIHVVL